jgi:hypothetical protein
LYIKIKNKFLITNSLRKWQRNVHKHAGVRKYSPPLTELCICHLPEQEFESILLPPQLQTVEGQPELILDWERVDTHRLGETDNGNKTVTPLTLRHTEVGCMSAHNANDGVGKQSDTEK